MGDASFDLSGLIRRVRRIADLSQRDLARRSGVTKTTIGRAECGDDLTVGQLRAILATAGMRLVAIDATGEDVAPMRPDAVRDNGGRRYPAHLDARFPRFPVSRFDYGRSRTRPLPQLVFEQRGGRDLRRESLSGPSDDHPSPQERPPRIEAKRVPTPPRCGCTPFCIGPCIPMCVCQCTPPAEAGYWWTSAEPRARDDPDPRLA